MIVCWLLVVIYFSVFGVVFVVIVGCNCVLCWFIVLV